MHIFSGVEKHSEQLLDQRLSLSVRLPILLHLLLGRTPVRRLAQSLIAVLILISPLSFSTDKITNFTYECPVSSGGSEKTVRAVAQQRAVSVGTRTYALQPVNRTAFPAPLSPAIELIASAFPCRAPPA